MSTLTSTVVVVHVLLKNCSWYCTLIIVNHTNTDAYTVYSTVRMYVCMYVRTYVCMYVSKMNVVLQQ